MSDVAMAHNLIAEIAGHCWRGKGDMIDRVHDAVSKRFPQWSRRRIRAFWHREAAGVRYHEMMELAEVAREEAETRKRVEDARKSHAEFIARTARVAEALVHQDEDFHCAQIGALRGLAGHLDCAGDR